MDKNIHGNSKYVNILIFVILVIEILYIVINHKKFVLNRMHIKTMFGHFVLYKVYFLILIIVMIALLGLLYKVLNINHVLGYLFLLVSLYLYVEYKLSSNHNITNKKKTFEQLKNQIHTGDFIIYETPRRLSDYFCLAPVIFLNLNHIGIWIKDSNGKLYILECDAAPHYCHYSKKMKTGVMLLNVEERLKEYDDYYLIKTNLHKYIHETDVYRFMEKYKSKDYMEDKLNCITLVLAFLKSLRLIKEHLVPPNPLYVEYQFLLDPDNYTKKYDCDIIKIKKIKK